MTKLVPVTLRLDPETDVDFLRRVEWEFSPFVRGLSEAGRLAVRKLRALVMDGSVGLRHEEWQGILRTPDPRQKEFEFRPDVGRAPGNAFEEATRRAPRCISLSRRQTAAMAATLAYVTSGAVALARRIA